MHMKRLLLLAALLCAGGVQAMTNIPEGAIVKTANNPDVYIVKYQGGKRFKRLVLNPAVFKSYGHLKWENLLIISPGEMDSYTTSDLVRVDGTTEIFELLPNGDVGSKYLLASTSGYDTDGVYTINAVDAGNYVYQGKKNENAAANLVLYYSDTCPHCTNVETYLAQNHIAQKIAFAQKNVRTSSANSQELISKAALCGMSTDSLGVPFLWDGENGNKCLVGDGEIIAYFKNRVGAN